jgi:cytochrome c oxidase subunit II
MRRITLTKPLARSLAILLVVLLSTSCAAAPITPQGTPNSLTPGGPFAGHLASLWWLMFGLGAAIWVLVVVLLFAALSRRRRGDSATPPESQGGDTGRKWVIRGGLILPLIALVIVFGYSTYTLAAVERQKNPNAVHIKVIARRWWWEVHYPDSGVITANEIHMPVSTPVEIELQSADVIHSFWVPELHGKMDLIPTRINSINLEADKAGVYRGECAEFCGLQHAHMGFMVVAQSSQDFNSWITAQQQGASPPAEPAAQAGAQVFTSAGCVFCHTIRGTDDKAIDRSSIDLGPDLTHLASRLTIAGGTLTMDKGDLAGWVVDPQHTKPGSLMPNQYINSQDLQNLLAFLTSLK